MHEILKEVSALILSIPKDERLFFNREEIQDLWLGYPPATLEDIQLKEEELGIELPESYKEFLLTSNGFKQITHFVAHLFPVQKIGWLRDLDPDLIDAYFTMVEFDAEITDEQLSLYDEEHSGIWRYSDFKNCIMISDWGDSAILLLNPNSFKDGECEVWGFANWYPGAVRYPNFRSYLKSALQSTKLMLKEYDDS